MKKMTRKAGLILAAAAVAVVAGLLLAPALVDWNAYKPVFAGRFEHALGRKVSIDGPLSLSLLPMPALSATDVHIANIEGASTPDMVSLQSVSARLDLSALLTGRVVLSSLVLVAPEVHLERLADGHANWVFNRHVALPDDATAISAPMPSAPRLSEGTRLDAVRVEKGVLVYHRAGRAPLRLEAIDGSFAASGERGPVTAKGSARFAGVDFTFDGTAAAWGADGPLPVTATLGLQQGGSELRLAGEMTGSGDDRRFKGKLTAKANDLAGLLQTLGAATPLPAGPASLAASLTGSADEVEAQGLTLAYGALQASGSAGLTLSPAPQVNLALAAGRLDLDGLLPAAKDAPAAPATGAPPAPAPTPAATVPAAAGFAIPAGMAANLDLSADVVTYRGGLLRHARLNAALANGEVTINQAGVSLPGDSQVNLFGFLVTKDGAPSFDGSFEAATDDLRGLLAWLHLDAGDVPADRLRTLRLDGQLKATPEELRLASGRMQLDSTHADLAATLRPGPRPALGASFALDSFNADAYWPHRPKVTPASATGAAPGSAATAAPTAAAAATAGADPAPPQLVPRWLQDLDANVKGRVGQLVLRGWTLQELGVDGSWVNGLLTLRELSAADAAGAQVRLAGDVSELSGGSPHVQGLHYDIHSQDPARLARQLGWTPPVEAGALGVLAASGVVNGGADRLTVDSRAEVGGGVLGIVGTVTEPFHAPGFDLAVEASHSSATQLVRLFAPDYRPSATLGAFAASTKLAGDRSQIQLTDLRLKVGPVTAAGAAKLALAGKPRIEATLSAGEVPVDAFLQSKRQASARPALGEMVASGLLIPSKPAAMWHGVPVSPAEGGEVAAAPRPRVQVAAIPDQWSREPLDLTWLRDLDAALTLDARAVTWGGTRFDSPSLVLNLTDGLATVDKLNAQLYGGKLTGNGKLDAEGNAMGQVALAHAQMHQALLGVADLDIAEGAMDVDAALATSGHSTAEMLGRLAGKGKIAIHDGEVRGFDLQAADERLRNVDGPASLLSLFQAGLSGGKTRFSSLGGSFRAEAGIITSNDIELVADGGGAKGAAQINLPARMMDAHVDFHLASAPAAPPLVMRLTGPLNSPRRFVDINPLQTWLAQKGIPKALKSKEAAKLMGTLLGGGKDNAEGSAAPAGGEKVKAKDVLKGLMQSLGR